jgi:mono/diheme cytochrome c family protein
VIKHFIIPECLWYLWLGQTCKFSSVLVPVFFSLNGLEGSRTSVAIEGKPRVGKTSKMAQDSCVSCHQKALKTFPMGQVSVWSGWGGAIVVSHPVLYTIQYNLYSCVYIGQ